MKEFLIKYMLIIALFILVFCQTTVLATFEDINGHWAEETILEFVEKEYILSGDSNFMPDAEITKGEVATLVNRYFAYGIVDGEEDNLQIAMDNGYLMNGDVLEKITREETAILLCKVLSLSPVEEPTNFVDDDAISLWAKGYVSALAKEKIMFGYPNQTCQPQKNITKAEFVTILNRCIGVGGVDLEILDTESKLEIGTFELSEDEMKYVSIENQLQLKTGDSIVLALKVPEGIEEEAIRFKLSQEEVVDWDKELYLLTALKVGETEMIIQVKEEVISLKIIVEE